MTGFRNIAASFSVAWQRRDFARKAVSFGLIGLLSTAIDVSVFFLALDYLTRSLVVANVLGWLVAMTYSYATNSFITFAHESGRKLRWRDYGKFAASGIAGATVSTITLLIAAPFMPVWAAKGCAIVAGFLVNFSLSHFVVFRRKQTGNAP